MRYTTIIDISTIPDIYKNINTKMIYLHLVLKSGYHSYDRDKIKISIRRLAEELNLTVSAVRHSLKLLLKYDLIQYDDTSKTLTVKKWLYNETIIPKRRNISENTKQIESRINEEKLRDEQNRMEEKKRIIELYKNGLTPFMIYYHSLQDKAKNGDAQANNLLKRHKEHYESDKKWVEDLLTRAKNGDAQAIKKLTL